MPEAQLFEFTGKGRPDEKWHAAHILIATKNTRLTPSPDALAAVATMPEDEKIAELEYMAATIPSSWEFIDVTFLLTGVTRAIQQQITRTRKASYAVQSLRVVDASEVEIAPADFNYLLPPEQELATQVYDETVAEIRRCYDRLSGFGVKREDARAILPLATESSLLAKYNFRNFVELVRARSSLRTQPSYKFFIDQMLWSVLEVWPWAEPFFRSPNEQALRLLNEVVGEIGLKVGEGPGWKIAKAMDLLRKGA